MCIVSNGRIGCHTIPGGNTQGRLESFDNWSNNRARGRSGRNITISQRGCNGVEVIMIIIILAFTIWLRRNRTLIEQTNFFLFCVHSMNLGTQLAPTEKVGSTLNTAGNNASSLRLHTWHSLWQIGLAWADYISPRWRTLVDCHGFTTQYF